MNSSFVFYDSFREATKGLDDSIRLDIYDAIMDYALYGIEPTLEGIALSMFILIRPQLDANKKRREDGQKGAEHGAKGGRPKANNPIGDTANNPIGDNGETPNVNANVNVNVNDNDSPPKSPQGESKHQDDRFDSFWQLYPKKKSKEDAKKAWRSLKPDGELYTRMMRSLSLQKQSPDWTKEGGKYAPYPATWLRGRRWEDEEPTAGAPPPQDKFLTLEDIYGQRGAERFRRSYARPEGGGAGL